MHVIPYAASVAFGLACERGRVRGRGGRHALRDVLERERDLGRDAREHVGEHGLARERVRARGHDAEHDRHARVERERDLPRRRAGGQREREQS
jgi:hypothetical protein